MTARTSVTARIPVTGSFYVEREWVAGGGSDERGESDDVVERVLGTVSD